MTADQNLRTQSLGFSAWFGRLFDPCVKRGRSIELFFDSALECAHIVAENEPVPMFPGFPHGLYTNMCVQLKTGDFVAHATWQVKSLRFFFFVYFSLSKISKSTWIHLNLNTSTRLPIGISGPETMGICL